MQIHIKYLLITFYDISILTNCKIEFFFKCHAISSNIGAKSLHY